MKKLIFLFFILSNLCFADTYVNWEIKETHDDKIEVKCSLSGDIYTTLRVEVSPFEKNSYGLNDSANDYDIINNLNLRVEKDLIFTNDKNTVNYTCSLKRDYQDLDKYRFKAKKYIVIESR